MYFDYFDQIRISTDYNLSIFIFTAHFSFYMQQTDIASNQQYVVKITKLIFRYNPRKNLKK